MLQYGLVAIGIGLPFLCRGLINSIPGMMAQFGTADPGIPRTFALLIYLSWVLALSAIVVPLLYEYYILGKRHSGWMGDFVLSLNLAVVLGTSDTIKLRLDTLMLGVFLLLVMIMGLIGMALLHQGSKPWSRRVTCSLIGVYAGLATAVLIQQLV